MLYFMSVLPAFSVATVVDDISEVASTVPRFTAADTVADEVVPMTAFMVSRFTAVDV